MIAFLGAHYGDILVLLILGAIVVWILGRLLRKKGRHSCCGSCQGCAMEGACGAEQNQGEERPR